MTVWFTADHHFGHANIIKYCNRPFASVQEMDEVMVARWNGTVGPDDTVYYLGDFTMRDDAGRYLRWLHGQVKVIPGGHDRRWVRRSAVTLSGHPVEILPPLYSLEVDVGKRHPLVIVLCHYPLAVWDRRHYGSLHLHGHSHGRYTGEGRVMDVGIDCHNFRPVSLGEVIATLRDVPVVLDSHRGGTTGG